MSISFHSGPRKLVDEIKRAGFRVVGITSDIGDPSRCLQITLKNGVVVNWDRESYCVWTQGPQPLSEKVEASLAARHARRRTRKTSAGFSLWATLILVGCFLLALAWQNLRNEQGSASNRVPPPMNEPPPAE